MVRRSLMTLAGRRGAWLAPAALAAALMLPGIGNNALWGDEAYTAILARNVLRSGYPTAWDGRNLAAFNSGAPLNKHLTEVQTPWVQFYLPAGAFALLGETTAAARLPFVALGVATVAAFYFLAVRLYGSRTFAFGCAAALAVWVPFLLFARQCRYYAPAMLAAVVMFHLWLDLSLARRGRFALFVLAAVFFFHTQFLMFACFFAALVLADAALERRRERLIAMAAAVPLIAAFTLSWLFAVGPPDDVDGRAFTNIVPDRWLTLFWWHLRDYNRGGFFPLLMLAPLCLYIADAMRRRGPRVPALGPAAVVLIFTALAAFTSPQPIQYVPGASPPIRYTRLADVRYCVAAIPLLVLVIAQSIRWLGRRSLPLAVTVAVLCFGTDLLTLGFLRPRYRAEVRTASPLRLPFRCLLAEYVHENTHDYQTPYEAAVDYLAARAAQDESLVAYPRFATDPLMFYLGSRLRFVSVLQPGDTRLVPFVKHFLPPDIYTAVRPDWIVAFGFQAMLRAREEFGLASSRDYELATLDVYGLDTTRPELFWRTFGPVRDSTGEERIFIWRRTKPVGNRAR